MDSHLPPIPITKPFFGDEEIDAVTEPLKTGWVVQGPFVEQFERKFSAFTESVFSVATTSCTTALHLSVAMLGLKPGDEVILPAFTWVSTANVIEYMGAKPVFCDIDLGTLNIDPDQIASLVTAKTVGIIPVHLFGLCADMTSVLQVARKRHLWIVEDAACAFGAWYYGKHAGTFGDTGCFSFHPRKSITTGEGGMLTTQSDSTDQLARSLRDHGASRTDLDRHTSKYGFLLAEYGLLGYNYRMTDLQAAIGSVQMDKARTILESRQQQARRYDQLLSSYDWIMPPLVLENYIHGYQSYVTLFCPEVPSLKNVDRLHVKRNNVMADLDAKGIATRQGTHSPVIQSYYAEKYGLRFEQFPNAYIADRLTLALPMYVQLTEKEQDRVCRELSKAING